MIISGKSRKTVLLLGAGATRGAFRHVNYRQKRLRPPLNRDFFKIAETFGRAHGANSTEMHHLKRILAFFKTSVPVRGTLYMEDAFSILYVAKDLQQIYRSKPGRAPSDGSSREVDDFLFLVHRILHVFDGEQSAYDRLVSKLEPGDTVITLNYDTVLDTTLHRAGWDPAVGYSLKGGASKVKWKALSTHLDSPVRRTRLLKLHGSLNWYVQGTTKKLHSVFDKKPRFVRPPTRNAASGYLRQIIPPVYGKTFRHAHWSNLWQRAYDACVDAEVFGVVGCSLIDTDFHLRAFLSRVCAVRKKASKRFHRVLLADRAKIRRKWLAVLKGAHDGALSSPTFEALLRETLRT